MSFVSKKKVVIYCRQSSGKEEESESIAAQALACQNKAKELKLQVLGVFSDANTSGRLYPSGATAEAALDGAYQRWLAEHTTDKKSRPGLQEALDLFKETDYMLVYDITRLYRPLKDSYLQGKINNTFRENNVRLISVKEGVIDFENFTDGLIYNLTAQVNDNQLVIGREKSKKALQALVDNGIYCSMPRMYGIKYLGGKEKAIEVIPERAEVIRFIYNCVLKHWKYTDIVNALNTKYKHLCDGKHFYDSSWRHIIANPFYAGYMRNTSGDLIPAKQIQGKELVTLEEWRRVNEIVNVPLRKGHGRKHNNLPFSGLMYCGTCESKMSVVNDNKKICYACLSGTNLDHNADCGKSRTNVLLVRKSENYTGLKESIRPFLLLALYKDIEHRNGTDKIKDGIQKNQIELDNLNARLKKISDEYAEIADNTVTFKAYADVYAKMEKKISAKKSAIAQLENEIKSATNARQRAEEYFSLAEKVLRGEIEDGEFTELLHKSVRRINCFETYVEIVTLYGTVKLNRYMDKTFRNFPKFD